MEPFEQAMQVRKSTNVRYLSIALRALAAVAPGRAAAALEALFLTVRRHPEPARERDWLAGSESWTVRSGGHAVVARAWGRGPAVLLVHGWEGRGSQLGAFVAPLVAAGFRPVTFDAPGHGQSTGRTSSLVEMADAVLAVGREVGPLRGAIAHSVGASAVTVALAVGLEVDRAVFVSPPADPGRFLDAVAAWLGLPAGIARRTRARIERRFAVEWDRLITATLAPEMTAPLLVFHDRGDVEVPWGEGRELVRRWPAARLVTTSGLGHRRILRDPDVVAGAARFVAAGEGEAAEAADALAAVAAGGSR
jgi:pimeloyl-ACP methyl ester carboxylesterase